MNIRKHYEKTARFLRIPWVHDPELQNQFGSCPRNSHKYLQYYHNAECLRFFIKEKGRRIFCIAYCVL